LVPKNALHDAHSWAKPLATGFGVPCRLVGTNRFLKEYVGDNALIENG